MGNKNYALKIGIFISIIFLSKFNLAQNYPLTINISVIPPYSADYTSYYNGETQVLITINNTTANNYQIYFAGRITSTEGAYAGLKGSSPTSSPIDIQPGINQFDGNTLAPFLSSVNNSQFEFSGITENDIRLGLLPEGVYRICLEARDYFNTQPLSQPVGQGGGCSSPFFIRYVDPPVNLQPCEQDPVLVNPQNLIFRWQPVVAAGANSEIVYSIKIVELLPNQNPYQALETAQQGSPTFIVQRETNLTSFNLEAFDPPLIPGKKYAWRVVARDANNQVTFRNQGKSEACEIILSDPSADAFYGSSGLHLRPFYPSEGDWYPFQNLPLAVEYFPYNESYKRWESTCRLENADNGSELDRFSRTLRWPNSPSNDQETAIDLPVLDVHARTLSVYKNKWLNQNPQALERGKTYQWYVEGKIIHRDQTVLQDAMLSQFNFGMAASIPKSPQNNSTIAPGTVTLKFQTASEPEKLLPDFDLRQSQERGHGNGSSAFYAEFKERWRLEVSRNANFSEIIHKQVGDVLSNGTSEYMMEPTNESVIRNILFTEAQVSKSFTDIGDYYWRICWIKNPDDPQSEAYQISNVWKFTIGDGVQNGNSGTSVQTDEQLPQTPESCTSVCEASPITNRESIYSTRAGNEVKLGKFDLKITEITYSNGETGLAEGKGTIKVPFLKAPIKVTFENLRINVLNQVFEGEAAAEYDNASIIPSYLQSALGQATGALPSLSDNQAEAIENAIIGGSRLVTQLFTEIPTGLPIGLDQEIDGKRYVIGIVGLKFTPEEATLNGTAFLDLPQLMGHASFGITNVCIHPEGISGGKAMLYLPLERTYSFGNSSEDGEFKLKPVVFDGNYTAISDSGTYIRFDCNGFHSLRLKAEIQFSRNQLLPENEQGTIIDGKVTARIHTTIRRTSDWLAEVDMDRFQFKGLDGIGFSIQNMALDQSGLNNPIQMHFPEGYAGDKTESWKGFYAKNIGIHLPKGINTNTGNRISISAQNLIIDETGLSINAGIDNILAFEQARVENWALSIDRFSLNIVSSVFLGGELKGRIGIPISPQALNYSALLRLNNPDDNETFRGFEFSIQNPGTITAPLWASTLVIDPNARIEVQIPFSGSVTAKADLSGSLSISSSSGVANDVLDAIDMREIRFEHLVAQTQAPYLDVANISFASPQKRVAGFPVGVDNFEFAYRMEGSNVLAGLRFDLDFQLTGESNTFSANTNLSFLGKVNPSNFPMIWQYHSIELNKINIAGDIGIVELEGELLFFRKNDLFGNGFKGFIEAQFLHGKISVNANVQVGTKENIRYWYADASATFPAITIAPGIGIEGFGGGAYYNMNQIRPSSLSSEIQNTEAAYHALGAGSGGIEYRPQSGQYGLFARADLTSSPGGDKFKGDITIGAQFGSGFSLTQLNILGNVYVMPDASDKTKANLKGTADLRLTLSPACEFTGRFTLAMNMAGGSIRGAGENDLIGSAELFFSEINPNWYIKVGTPESPLSIHFGMPGIKAGVSAYLMIGKQLTGVPPALSASRFQRIRNIATRLNVPNPPNQSLTGDGFAFGAQMEFEKSLNFAIFYAQFYAAFGFDLSLLKTNAICANTGAPIGANGWYTRGQLYAGVGGSIGIDVDLWLVSGKYEILGLDAAVYLAGGFPNPSYFQGIVGGEYRILGGLVKGNCRFELKVGEACPIMNENPMADIQIIAEVNPKNNPSGDEKTDTGILPEALLNIELDEPFDLEEMLENGQYKIRTFRVKLAYFKLTKEENNQLVNIDPLQYNSDKTLISMVPISELESNKRYKLEIKVLAEERVNGNWIASKYTTGPNSGRQIFEERIHVFNTGPRPNYIRASNVLYSYPMHNQRALLSKQNSKGILSLRTSQGYLFNAAAPAGKTFTYSARYTAMDLSDTVEAELTWDEGMRTVRFTIPNNLNPETIYCLQLIRKTNTAASNSNSAPVVYSFASNITNTLALSNAFQMYSGNTDAYMTRKRQFLPDKVRFNEELLYRFFFKTSKYGTLSEKIAGIQVKTNEITGGAPLSFESYSIPLQFTELFETREINGFSINTGSAGTTPQHIPGLIKLSYVWSGNWVTGFANPRVYQTAQYLKQNNIHNFNLRAFSNFGVPPVNAIQYSSNSTFESPLSMSEINPPMDAVKFVLIPWWINTAPQSIIIWSTPIWAYYHWNVDLRNAVNAIIAARGPLAKTNTRYSPEMRTQLNAYLVTPFESSRGNNHEMEFRFTPLPKTSETMNLYQVFPGPRIQFNKP